MAMRIRSEHGLPTLRVVFDRSVSSESGRPHPAAVLESVVGSDEPKEICRISTADLGLPDRVDAAHSLTESQFRMPRDARRAVAAAVAGLDAGGARRDALWLEVPAPRGYLHLLPWERLLADAVSDRPVFRLPYYALKPQTARDSMKVAICSVLPQAALRQGPEPAALVEGFARSWARQAGRHVWVHVFVRGEHHGAVRRMLDDLPHVVVHDPEQASDLPGSGKQRDISPADLSTNPWLLWMAAALGGQALDVVHVLTHGELTGSTGRFLLARSPVPGEERDVCLLVGATPLSGGLSQLGAWATVLSGMPGNPAPAGLRELADATAQLRPGMTVAHEIDGDAGAELDTLIAQVFGKNPPSNRTLPSVTCWMHPQLVDYPAAEQGRLHLSSAGESNVIEVATTRVLTAEDTPAWVAAGSRCLEVQQAEWLGSDPDAPIDYAAVTALQSVSSLLEAHVRQHVSDEVIM